MFKKLLTLVLIFISLNVFSQNDIAIIDYDGNHNSSNYMIYTLTSLGLTADLYYQFPTDLTNYRTVFVCLGMFDNNYFLRFADGNLLFNYLNGGGTMYIEGGDTWAYDYPTAVYPLFKIKGILDGLNDLDTIYGVNNTITENFTLEYVGDNFWVDRITADTGGVLIFNNNNPQYGVGVSYDGGYYKTIGTTFEFGGINLPTTKKGVMGSYLEFFNMKGIYGSIYYDDINQTKMDSVIVNTNNLYDTTNNKGWYNLPIDTTNNYHIDLTINNPFGGINSVDALFALKHFVSLDTLSGLQLIAGDVNSSGFINATDALLIAQRSVGVITSFPGGDWVCDDVTVNHNISTFTHKENINVLCMGDLNGSYYNTTIKEFPQIVLLEEKQYTLYDTVTVPIILDSPKNMNSFTMIIYVNDYEQIDDIRINENLNGYIVYNLNYENNYIYIVWYSLDEYNISDQPFMYIKTSYYDTPIIELKYSLFTNSNGKDMNVNIILPKLIEYPNIIKNVYPNPTSTYLNVEFDLPLQSTTQVSLYDMIGNQVFTDKIEKSVDNYLIYNNYPVGVYLLETKTKLNNGKIIINTHKIIFN